jgi:UDP-N-acetylmuramyl pentapeptide phosphotransferase/UDP-N-acetylglucosamine-1-phosphate transferase
MILHLVILSLIALGVSYLGVAGLRRWAEQRQLLDMPNERSSHSRPMPRGGGLAIVFVTLAGIWLDALLQRPVTSRLPLLAYTLGAIIIAVSGWLDDLRSLPVRVRFFAHGLGALLVIGGIGYWRIAELPLSGQLQLGWLGLPLIFFWIVGLTNSYNFMDGIDGIAGGQAVVAGLGWALIGWLANDPLVSALGALTAAGSLGFLGHNWPPARIFMGDVASGFLGYTFAVLPVIAALRDARLLLVGALLVWPFLFDTIFTFLRRLSRGENVFAAHRSHLYQRLVIAERSHRFVTSLYIMLALVGGVLSMVWLTGGAGGHALIALLLPLLSLALWLYVIRQERRKCAAGVATDAVMLGERM